MSYRYDLLQPPDIIAALRSMPRRFGHALYAPSPEQAARFFDVTGPDGRTAAEDVGALLAQLAVLDEAIRATRLESADDLDAGVATAMADRGSGDGPDDARAAMTAIELQTTELADFLDGMRLGEWSHEAVLDGARVSLIDLARGAVRVAADRLASVEHTLGTSDADEDD